MTVATAAVSRKTGKPKSKSKPTPAAAIAATGIVPAGTPVEAIPLGMIDVLPGNPDPDPDVVTEIVQHGIDEPVILIQGGLLQCPATVLERHAITTEPDRYILLAGASRLEAAHFLQAWTIDARVRREPLDWSAAIAFALRSNTGRRVVTTTEKAGRVNQLAACGLSDQEIAAQLSLQREEVNQLRRFAELPRVWQDRVSRFDRSGGQNEDSISWAAAKAMLPYADVPAVLSDLETEWADDWSRAEMRSRDAFRETVQSSVLANSRPVLSGQSFYDQAEHQHRIVPKKTLDPITSQELAIRDVQINGKKEPRAFCDHKTYDAIFPPLPKSNGKAAPANTLDGDPATRAQKTPAPTAAEQRAKEKADDEELADRLRRNGGLREIGLRIACCASACLNPGSAPARNVARWLAVCARDSAGASELNPSEWMTAAAQIWASRNQVTLPKLPTRAGWSGPSKEQYTHFWAAFRDLDDPLDAQDQVEVEFSKLVLWPQAEDLGAWKMLSSLDDWPERIPALSDELVQLICGQLLVTIEDAWQLARRPDSAAQQWLRKCLEAHDRRQLTALARAEMSFSGCSCGSIEEFASAKKTEQIAIVLEAHARSNLRLPKLLAKGAKR